MIFYFFNEYILFISKICKGKKLLNENVLEVDCHRT